MVFNLIRTINILRRTPLVLSELLQDLDDNWTLQNEGEGTWSPYDVLGHLIHGEKTDWIVRTQIILSDRLDKTFESFDRFAQMENAPKSMMHLLNEFKSLRNNNLKLLAELDIQQNDLLKHGIHPELGRVTLKELLATWTVHDLGHIAQISRVMAKQYKSEVGPWQKYLGVLKL